MSEEKVTLAGLGTKAQSYFDIYRRNRSEAARLRAVVQWHEEQAKEARRRFQETIQEFLAVRLDDSETDDSETVRAIHVRDTGEGRDGKET